jgi:hypothetical protein
MSFFTTAGTGVTIAREGRLASYAGESGGAGDSALCAEVPMSEGRHYTEVTIVKLGYNGGEFAVVLILGCSSFPDSGRAQPSSGWDCPRWT